MNIKPKSFKFLLVDDDELDVKILKRAFEKNNIKDPIDVMRNGMEALEYLNEKKSLGLHYLPNMILLDMNMPLMNGLEFLKQIRNDKDFKRIPVTMLTTSNDQENKKEAYQLNVAGYIVKPLQPAELEKSVATLKNFWSTIEIY